MHVLDLVPAIVVAMDNDGVVLLLVELEHLVIEFLFLELLLFLPGPGMGGPGGLRKRPRVERCASPP